MLPLFVLDPHVIESGLRSSRIGKDSAPPAKLVRLALLGRIQFAGCEDLVAEWERRLLAPEQLEELRVPYEEVARVFRGLLGATTFREGRIESSPIVEKDPDDMLCVTAWLAGADAIVTGVRELLNLKHYQRIQIISAADALALVEGRGRGSG